MTKTLLVLANGRDRVGVLRADARGYMSFEYDPEWLASPAAYPVSQSIPLRDGAFDHQAIEPFFDGLLPDKRMSAARSQHCLMSHRRTSLAFWNISGAIAPGP